MSDETTSDDTATTTDEPVTDEPTTGDCAQTLRELDIFLDGELSNHQQAAIRHHLDGCMDCLGAFDFHAELKIVVAQKCNNDEMPADLLGKIERCFGTDFDGDGTIG